MATPRTAGRRGRLLDMDVDSSGSPTIIAPSVATTASTANATSRQSPATPVTRRFIKTPMFVTKQQQQVDALVFASPPPPPRSVSGSSIIDDYDDGHGYHNPTSPTVVYHSSRRSMVALPSLVAPSSFRPSTPPPNKRSIGSTSSSSGSGIAGRLDEDEATLAAAAQSPSAPELGVGTRHNYQYPKNRGATVDDSHQPSASPNKRALSTSMSALPELPLRSPLNTSTGDLASRLDRFQIDIADSNQLYTSLRSRSGVQMNDKANTPLSASTGDVVSNVPHVSQLIGAEKVCTLLTNTILKPIAQPGLYYNVQMPRLLWIKGVTGVGARTAVLSMCQPVANVLVYRSIEPEHEDDAFFNDLITFALTKQPCVLVCHRIDERLQELKEGAHVASVLIKRLVSVWRSRISTDGSARVWLVFCQRQSPALYHAYLRCTTGLDSCAEFPSFRSGEDAALCARNMMKQHFEARLKNADAVAQQMDVVFPVARQIVVQGHGGELFSTAKSIKAFVDLVFRLPLDRCSIETVAEAATNLQVLPAGNDFEQTYLQFFQKATNERKLKEQQQQQQNIF